MKSKVWKFTKRTLLIALLLGAIFIVNLIWFKPFFINHFYDRVFVEFAFQNPQLFTQMGQKFYYDELNDNSFDADERNRKIMFESYDTLKSYDRNDLSGQKLISYDVLDQFLADSIEGDKYEFYGYSQTQRGGMYQGIISFMTDMHRVDDQGDAEDYISRLSHVGRVFDNTLLRIKKERDNGAVPPKFIIKKIIENLHNIRDPELADNVLVKDFNAKVDKLSELDENSKNTLKENMLAQMNQTVQPAYDRMIALYEELDSKSDNRAGVWKFDKGDEYYQYRIKSVTTTNYTPEYLHTLGLEEVDRIVAEIKSILTTQGYDTTKTVGKLLNEMSKESQFLYPDSNEGREQILKDYQVMIDEIDKDMSETFGILPKGQVVVKRTPEYRQKTAAGGSYSRPSKDGSRPGIFYANLYDITATPKFGMRTLAYHEAVPGHHFQLAIQNELQGLPMFRGFLGFTGYTEGWALYAERLAYELGFQTDPFSNVGRLQAELMRAVRLVVDTGIHHKRWTREEAIEYMFNTTGLAMTDVESEIERYIVWPGQALAYKVGMIKIMELRELSKQELGDKFDIRDFHDVVLKNGAIPLNMLEEQVKSYIQATKT